MNPKAYVMNFMKKNNNPIVQNMANLAEQGKTKELEQIVRNAFKEQGIDYDKQANILQQFINIKK